MNKEPQPIVEFEIDGDLEPETLKVEDQTEEEIPEEDSEPAAEEKEGVKFDAKQQKVFEEALAKKVYKQREAERESERLRRELDEVKARLPKQERPPVYESPDPFAYSDQEYRQRLQYREQSLVQAAQWDAQQNALRYQEQVHQNEQARKQHEVLADTVKTYADRAVKMGVRREELQAAGNLVAQAGLSEEIVQFILHEEQGALFTKYLADHPSELEELKDLTPTRAAVRLATIIKPKLSALQPKVNRTPDPLVKMSGSGRPPKPSGAKGVTYE
jgi:hypothetical protein